MSAIRRKGRSALGPSPITVLAPLTVFAAVLAWGSGVQAAAVTPIPNHHTGDREAARFAHCAGPVRVSCFVDGDTFWYRGTKIRVADINAPETSQAHCAAEAQLGAQATRRLTELLNAGHFILAPVERETDAYGRRLFVVTRGETSLGAILEAEGLAEPRRGPRSDWC
jgi:endonuclease YncB( thermonuclease family)